MNKFYWLVKREFWEHRGGFLWAPLITAGVVIALDILSMVAGAVLGDHQSAATRAQHLAMASPAALQKLAIAMNINALVPFIIVSIVLFFVLYGYCMKTLSGDRVDRSILFWKSLPVSDTATVASKAFSAIVVAPVIAFVVGAISALIMVLIGAISYTARGGDFGQLMWGLAHPAHLMLAIISALPVYWVWMLPAVGWFMMCSAFSAGKPRRWAIALPIAIGALFTWIAMVEDWGSAIVWFWRHVIGRLLLSMLPATWAFSPHILPDLMREVKSIALAPSASTDAFGELLGHFIGQQYRLLWTAEIWWGALAGIIMIGIAVWLRRWRTEL